MMTYIIKKYNSINNNIISSIEAIGANYIKIISSSVHKPCNTGKENGVHAPLGIIFILKYGVIIKKYSKIIIL